ncbi:unnamed protein product [Paramecium sonneborni]|uniref:Ubiquitin-like domain-containing protein n=1 Tax=Paramecium sonneborni TaxID=65129 RepID=A0A8S1R6U3_9CILI|nr:unnamed protein product [Paramecium sonneborni]
MLKFKVIFEGKEINSESLPQKQIQEFINKLISTLKLLNENKVFGIFMNGSELKKDKTFSDYKVKSGCILELKPTIIYEYIFLKIIGQQKTCFPYICSGEKAQKLYDDVAKELNLSNQSFTLLFQGVPLDRNKQLIEYNLVSNSIINCEDGLRIQPQITVKIQYNNQDYNFVLNQESRISDLEYQIKQKFNNKDFYLLKNGEQELQSNQKINTLNANYILVSLKNQFLQITPQQQIIQKEPQQEIIQRIPQQQIIQKETQQEIIQRTPQQEIIQKEPQQQIIQKETQQEIMQKELQQQIIQKEPQQEIVQKEPQQQIIQKEPQQQIIQKEPQQQIISKQPQQEIMQKELQQQIIQKEPQQEIVQKEPQIQIKRSFTSQKIKILKDPLKGEIQQFQFICNDDKQFEKHLALKVLIQNEIRNIQIPENTVVQQIEEQLKAEFKFPFAIRLFYKNQILNSNETLAQQIVKEIESFQITLNLIYEQNPVITVKRSMDTTIKQIEDFIISQNKLNINIHVQLDGIVLDSSKTLRELQIRDNTNLYLKNNIKLVIQRGDDIIDYYALEDTNTKQLSEDLTKKHHFKPPFILQKESGDKLKSNLTLKQQGLQNNHIIFVIEEKLIEINLMYQNNKKLISVEENSIVSDLINLTQEQFSIQGQIQLNLEGNQILNPNDTLSNQKVQMGSNLQVLLVAQDNQIPQPPFPQKTLLAKNVSNGSILDGAKNENQEQPPLEQIKIFINIGNQKEIMNVKVNFKVIELIKYIQQIYYLKEKFQLSLEDKVMLNDELTLAEYKVQQEDNLFVIFNQEQNLQQNQNPQQNQYSLNYNTQYNQNQQYKQYPYCNQNSFQNQYSYFNQNSFQNQYSQFNQNRQFNQNQLSNQKTEYNQIPSDNSQIQKFQQSSQIFQQNVGLELNQKFPQKFNRQMSQEFPRQLMGQQNSQIIHPFAQAKVQLRYNNNILIQEMDSSMSVGALEKLAQEQYKIYEPIQIEKQGQVLNSQQIIGGLNLINLEILDIVIKQPSNPFFIQELSLIIKVKENENAIEISIDQESKVSQLIEFLKQNYNINETVELWQNQIQLYENKSLKEQNVQNKSQLTLKQKN